MAMDDRGFLSDRAQTIAGLIAAELDRQVQHGASKVQVDAFASAIDTGLSTSDGATPSNEGKHPDELNSANDD